MSRQATMRLALIITAPPYAGREPRGELDIALAALALDHCVEVYFLGESVLQMAADRDVSEALLPAGYAAWPAMPELGEARLFAEDAWAGRCRESGIELSDTLEFLAPGAFERRWRQCDRVLVL